VERFIASRLGEGVIAHLGYAYKIIWGIYIAVVQGLAIAIYPQMSEHSIDKDYKELREINSKGIRALIFVIVPFVLMLLLARNDLIRLLFERGNFTSQETIIVGNTLLAYLGVLISGIVGIPLLYALYSLQKTAKTAAIGIFAFIVYVILAFSLSHYFSYIGLALAHSVQCLLSMLLILYTINKKYGGLEARAIFRCTLKTTLAAALTALVLIFLHTILSPILQFPYDFFLLGTLGFGLYFVMLILLKTEELKFISSRFTFS
jgi:putative peptidoglycan lipid II flippase